MRRIVLCLLVLAAAVGCGKRATLNQTYTEGESPMGEPEETYGADVSLKSPEESDLAKAEGLVREQKFDDAQRIFEDLVERAHGDVREEALYELGDLQGHLLNPNKDYQRAIVTLNRLLAEYPGTKYRLQAEQAIERFESFQTDDQP
jgi:hypothetical protein